MMKWLGHSAMLLVIACVGCDQQNLATPAEKSHTEPIKRVSFNAHIRPIFSDTCFACHGFDANERKADLRLDTPEGAYAKLKDSEARAIVPGKPEQSAILKRIVSTDPDEVMPPPDFHKDLTVEQKSLIHSWIEQGAEYEQHWAFVPVKEVARPLLAKHADKVANPIDSLILATLENEKIDPSPLADKAVLLRRLSLDLTGMPPSLEELKAFLADQSPDAYQKQVERLLASPQYGERMAVPWLDVARFSDTVGYHGDQNMRVFPYRDYVIRAFNQNKRFDQFTIEQLAGDLLPNATDEQKIATGFLRLNLVTREGGAQDKEYLAKYAGDRVRAVGAAWLGLTVGCAECHDHKFDPITARDFYSLSAFFADIRQWGVYSDFPYTPNPELPGYKNDYPFPPEIYARNEALEKRIDMLQRSGVEMLATLKNQDDEASFEQWIARNASFLAANPTGWQSLTPVAVAAAQGTAYEILADQSVVFTGAPTPGEVFTLDFPLPEQSIRSIRLEALPAVKNDNKVGRRAGGKFSVKSSFSIKSKSLEIAWSQADRRTPRGYKNGDENPLLEEEWHSASALWEEPKDATQLPHHALYHLAQPLINEAARVLRVTLASEDIGSVRISITPFGDAIPGQENALRKELANALVVPVRDRSETDLKELSAGWMQGTLADAKLPVAYRRLRDSVIDCRAGYAFSVIAQAVPADKIPSTHLLPRGAWMSPGEEVQPAVPEFLPHASVPSDGSRLTRLDLANWLMADENPLVARQFINRLWKQFFGNGLSNVLDDLGNQGEWPYHPQLLDWLAGEFRHSGWDIKHMVRLMVNSHTYRQVVATRPELAERDPANRLLAEQSARRLDAEFIRDNALAISGLLRTDLVGGPSVKPYQPAGYFQNLTFPDRVYNASVGDDQYRRGVYTHWQRTFMHPMLAGFDAPSREVCSADRFHSNSPQQALTLLNDPSFVEAARAFAVRIMNDQLGSSDQEKIHHAMRLGLSRDAKPMELASLTSFLISQRDVYQNKPDDAVAFFKTGFSEYPAGKDPVELAAWTQLCRVILNLHETITRY